jgi:hypothetical protein
MREEEVRLGRGSPPTCTWACGRWRSRGWRASGKLGNIDAGGVGELERLGDGERTVDKFALRRDHLDAQTRVG